MLHGHRRLLAQEGRAALHKVLARTVAGIRHLVAVRRDIELVEVDQSQLVSHFMEQAVVDIFVGMIVSRAAGIGVHARSIARGETCIGRGIDAREGSGVVDHLQHAVCHPLLGTGVGEHLVEAVHVAVQPVDDVVGLRPG